MTSNRILLVGFTRRTSFAAAQALLARGCTIGVSDLSHTPDQDQLIAELASPRLVSFLGRQDEALLEEFKPELIMPSPGVPLTIPLLLEAKKKGIPVKGDIEVFYELHPGLFTIGITGTDGKTTTTHLTRSLIGREKDCKMGGNVGIPVFQYDQTVCGKGVLVLELSSFQLEAVDTFHPRAAAVLNIAEDHLDRYDSVESYMMAKKNIFKNQTADDIAVLNLDNPYTPKLREGIRAKVQTFSIRDKSADLYFDGESLYLQGNFYMKRADIRLKGLHNVENAMAAILMARFAGTSDEAIRAGLSEFEGLEHRLEYTRTVDGVEYYNDSKSTTVNAMEKALLSFDDGHVVLIAGGRDKGLDFTKIAELMRQKVHTLILIGEASEKIAKETSFQPAIFARSMEDAVQSARKAAKKGESVVFSPGCASFDMYKNYEERGRDFKAKVAALG